MVREPDARSLSRISYLAIADALVSPNPRQISATTPHQTLIANSHSVCFILLCHIEKFENRLFFFGENALNDDM